MKAPDILENCVAPSSVNTALVVVTFHPDEDFESRLAVALAQFGAVFVIDNTDGNPQSTFREEQQALYRQDNARNLGLGTALNQGCRAALAAGFEWVVTLDQDTWLDTSFLESMTHGWRASNPRAALLGCNYLSISRGKHKIAPSDCTALRTVKTVITSGTLMHLPTWSDLGEFREDFFIDSIDHELCLRFRRAGLRVAINPKPLMEHMIGTPTNHFGFLKNFLPYSHSPVRDYTNARNTIRVLMEYGLKEPLWSLRRSAGLTIEFLALVALETNKIHRLNLFLKGLAHGFTGKMGSLPGRDDNG